MALQDGFTSRIDEINEYFSFVKYIDKIETHKKEKIITSSNNEYTPKRELQKILRGNCYLLLYNLVESCINDCVTYVYDCIQDDSLKFEDLSKKLKEIWLKHHAKLITNANKNGKQFLNELISNAISGTTIKLDKKSIKISGNLDYDKISEIIDLFGFSCEISIDKHIIKTSLLKVKSERNSLAHGSKTFCNAGEIITLPELVSIKEHIYSFLSDVMHNVETYIENKKYKYNNEK